MKAFVKRETLNQLLENNSAFECIIKTKFSKMVDFKEDNRLEGHTFYIVPLPMYGVVLDKSQLIIPKFKLGDKVKWGSKITAEVIDVRNVNDIIEYDLKDHIQNVTFKNIQEHFLDEYKEPTFKLMTDWQVNAFINKFKPLIKYSNYDYQHYTNGLGCIKNSVDYMWKYKDIEGYFKCIDNPDSDVVNLQTTTDKFAMFDLT